MGPRMDVLFKIAQERSDGTLPRPQAAAIGKGSVPVPNAAQGGENRTHGQKKHISGRIVRTLQVIGDKREESKPEADLSQVLGALKELISCSARSLVGAVE